MANDYQERELTPSIKVNKIDRDTFNQKLGEGVLSKDELYFIVPKNQLDKVLDIPTGEIQGGGIADPSEKSDGQYLMFDGTDWVASDIEIPPQIDAYTKAETDSLLSSKADSYEVSVIAESISALEESISAIADSIPTKVSELTNDEGFITSAEVPTKVSDLTNDSGYQTATQVQSLIDASITTVLATEF